MRRWWIVGVTLLIAGLTLVVSLLLPPSFGSSADVSLTLIGQPGTPVSDAVTGSNDLASQTAQDVTSDAVVDPAAAAVGVDPDDLSGRLSGGTVSGQNIIRVEVQGADASATRVEAQAAAESLVRYVQDQALSQAAIYQRNLDAQLAPLDRQIAEARADVAGAAGLSGEQRSSAQTRLNTLSDRRAQLVGQAALQAASLIPQVEVSAAAGQGTQTAPRPALYTLIALVVGLFISVQTAIVIGRRRRVGV